MGEDCNSVWAPVELTAGGIVQELIRASPNAGTYGDCVAFPIGGEWDTGQCRYRR